MQVPQELLKCVHIHLGINYDCLNLLGKYL